MKSKEASLVMQACYPPMPKFYKWPPARTPAQLLERASLGLLVGSSIFLLFTGVFNIAYWYPWGFNFIATNLPLEP
jgi:hypothetical protein